jgi:hypothetical protein
VAILPAILRSLAIFHSKSSFRAVFAGEIARAQKKIPAHLKAVPLLA